MQIKPRATQGLIAKGTKIADQILALIEPLIEEAKKQERERIIAWGLELCPHWSDERTRDVRIMKRDCSLCWQALKEEK